MSSRPHNRLCAASIAVLAAMSAATAHAQSADRLGQSVWGHAAAFRADVDSLVRVDYSGSPQFGVPGLGTTLDFEDDLGLPDRRTLGDLLLGLRLGQRGRLELETYRLNRSATRAVGVNDIVIDGTTYSAAAQLQTRFESQVIRLGLGYALVKSPDTEFGLALGAQYTKYDLEFSGVGSVGNGPPSARAVGSHDSGFLPTIGVFGTARLHARWSVDARLDLLPLNSRRVRGGLASAEANLYFHVTPNLAAAVGYRAVEYRVDSRNDGDLSGRFQYEFRGPQLTLEAGF